MIQNQANDLNFNSNFNPHRAQNMHNLIQSNRLANFLESNRIPIQVKQHKSKGQLSQKSVGLNSYHGSMITSSQVNLMT